MRTAVWIAVAFALVAPLASAGAGHHPTEYLLGASPDQILSDASRWAARAAGDAGAPLPPGVAAAVREEGAAALQGADGARDALLADAREASRSVAGALPSDALRIDPGPAGPPLGQAAAAVSSALRESVAPVLAPFVAARHEGCRDLRPWFESVRDPLVAAYREIFAPERPREPRGLCEAIPGRDASGVASGDGLAPSPSLAPGGTSGAAGSSSGPQPAPERASESPRAEAPASASASVASRVAASAPHETAPFFAAALPIVLAAWALYRHLRRTSVLRNGTRRALLDLVGKQPGGTAHTMARALGIDRKTALYHLGVLRAFGHVECVRLGAWQRYVPAGSQAHRASALASVALASPAARAVMAALRERPDASSSELAQAAGIPRSTAAWHARRLRQFPCLEAPPAVAEPVPG
ncbi:MAG TPA: winged helix-turn-helix transcriptional regulator [Candidatus Thermoplasmatota archaeon]|nr:winged helix-turn-helix transcriptional regulator [Candidatus Thermoplasmatota archaeon]